MGTDPEKPQGGGNGSGAAQTLPEAATGLRGERRRAADRRFGLRQLTSRNGLAALATGAVLALAAINLVAFMGNDDSYLRNVAHTAGSIGVGTLLVGTACFLVAGILIWPARFDECWSRVEKVLVSGAFYFFAGLSLLLYAIHTTTSQTHPSLTFLIAMLGMAIMLFGTGSQAVGSIATAGAPLPPAQRAFERDPSAAVQDAAANDATAAARATVEAVKAAGGLESDAEKAAALDTILAAAEETERQVAAMPASAPQAPARGDWHPFKANAAIAGGAAVLTAIFGYGVIHFRTDIKDVFGYYDRYVKLRINACAAFDKTCVLNSASMGSTEIPSFTLADYEVDAELANGSPIYMVQSGNEIQLLLFSDAIDQDIPIRLKLVRKTDNPDVGREIDRDIDLTLSPKAMDDVSRQATDGRPEDSAAKLAERCRQYSDSRPVDCALAWMGASYLGDRLSTVLYSLNFYRKDSSVPIETQVGNIQLKLE